MYCDYFISCLSCTVDFITCFVICECVYVWVCVCVGVCMYGFRKVLVWVCMYRFCNVWV